VGIFQLLQNVGKEFDAPRGKGFTVKKYKEYANGTAIVITSDEPKVQRELMF
jgi:hypothetical protein